MNKRLNRRNKLHNHLDVIPQDGGGAQAEPYVRVRSTHIRPGNPRTGEGHTGLAYPASEREASGTNTSRPTLPEADDAQQRGRGSADRRESSNDTPEENGSDEELDDNLENILGNEDSETDSLFEYPIEEETYESLKPTPKSKEGKKMEEGVKLGIKIGSLNVRGRNATTGTLKKQNKFSIIKKWMRKQRITILALQDTHWDDDMVSELKLRNKDFGIFANNEDTNRGGIAFIIDEKRNKPVSVKITNLIEGRCSAINVKFETQVIDMVTVYMPTEKKEKINLLKKMRKELQTIENKSNIILTGDFNLVERDIDRSPQHKDDQDTVRELTKIKLDLKLIDGWRDTHGDETEFTWKGRHGDDYSMARIDRIYTTESQMIFTNEWEITKTEKILTDHAGVTVKILDPDPPFIGRGEWRLNPKLINHPHLHERATLAITNLENKLKEYEKREKRTRGNKTSILQLRSSTNPQTQWQKYKKTIQEIAKETEKTRTKQINKDKLIIDRKIRKLQKRLMRCTRKENEKEIRNELAKEEDNLKELLENNRTRSEEMSDARWFKENEKGTKLWYSLNKNRPQRQLLHSLFNKENQETKNTEEMMEIARNHHEKLQSKQEMNDERQEAIKTILGKIEKKLDTEQQTEMDKGITYKEVREVIRKLPNGKTPGCDGIPNEFWKKEIEWYKDAQRKDERRPDIVKIMKTVFRDINKFGIIDERFTEARMSLLYKKKDKRKIENYRPITLLNTDYKIYTTVLTKRLNKIAPNIINEDQAGFMPKRRITDQTKLTELVIKLCEIRKQNGIIFALDQEKAYDRIDHEYLWQTMKAFNFSEKTIIRMQNLYRSAKTAIRINGCVTETFEIHRGVRQGDPLSCLLYNIAIEPLFSSIRKSELKGIKISPHTDNALVTAYADDTTVYLSADDDPAILDQCIQTFCTASTAKFNEDKTEIIPIGDTNYRNQIIESRTFNGKRIGNGIKITKDQEAIRILGSWQGNNVNANNKWEEIIEKQKRTMKIWANSFPSALGRVRIAKSLIVSLAIYLMTVNGIPKNYLDEMDKNIRSFIWLGKKGKISWDRAIQNKKEGGIGAPSIKAIYEAIKVKWLKQWLSPDETRPKWAWAVNEIIERNIRPSPWVSNRSKTEWIEQRWQTKIKSNEIPTSIREMLQAARRYNTKISVIKAPLELKLRMPAFFHPGSKCNKLNNTKPAKCLRKNHGVLVVRDLVMLVYNETDPDETHCELGLENCRKYAKKLLNNLTDLWNPLIGTPRKNSLYHTPNRTNKYKKTDVRTSPVGINPDPMDQNEPLENVRIFGNRTGYKKEARFPNTPSKPLIMEKITEEDREPEEIELYTDGSALRNGWENGETGLGIWHQNNSQRNRAMKITGKIQTNQRAELAAILVALRENRRNNLLIYTDSMSSITAIYNNLNRYEDLNWYNVKNSDILMEILHETRTRPTAYRIKWVKAHEDNEGNNEADRLANEGRISNEIFELKDHNPENSRALHDGARLQTLEMKDMYQLIIKELTKKKEKIPHPEIIEDSKDRLTETTSLRPTTETIIANTWRLHIPNRLKDHIWNLSLSRINCGKYWNKIPNFEHRAFCSCCAENSQDTYETEQHIWLECEFNGQKQIWNQTKYLWNKTTKRKWPNITLGLIRGIAALTLTDKDGKPDFTKDSERLRILICLAVWTIWKTRNKKTISNDFVAPEDAVKSLNENIKDLISKTWNSLQFEEPKRRAKKEESLRNLWADGTIVKLNAREKPLFDF